MTIRHLRMFLLGVTACASLAAVAAEAPPGEPARVIFDTDIGNDVDDVLALGLLHALETRGACRLLAVTITKDHPAAAALVDAVNTFYGRGSIPIGVVRGGPTPDAGKFLRVADDFPHDLDGARAPEATGLLREVLAAQPDGAVTIVQVGFSSNLARLLDSAADARSPLAGVELVGRKVRLLSVMAGAFRPIDGRARYGEYNVKLDLAAARKLAAAWPTPIVYSGFEIGIAVTYPAVSIERDYGYVPRHPLAAAYRAYQRMPYDRPTWDLTSVLYAVFPDRGYFDLSPAGRVTVEDDSHTVFAADPAGTHRHLILRDAAQAARVREALVQLASQPPGARP